jgi:hypothetical protein
MSTDDPSESFVLKPREPFNEEIILPQNADELAKFMDQPLTAIAEAITGALASGPKSWTVMTGHIVQGMLKGKLLPQACREIKELRDKGKISDDFAEKKYGFKSWVDLLKTIDEETPDDDKLEALKAMFYSVNKTNVQDKEQVLNYQLFQIAKRLTSGELLTLRAVYKLYRSGRCSNGTTETLKNWAAQVSQFADHGSLNFVMRHEGKLSQEGLITEQIQVGSAPFVRENQNIWNKDGRITVLGIQFCENIETYKNDVARKNSEDQK